MPKVFGWQHLTFLAIFLVLGTVSLILAKVFLKERKGQVIFIKVLAGITLISVILNRIFVAIHHSNIASLFPYTICSLTSFALSLVTIFGKENNNAYQALWYIGFVGGLSTLLYPDFIEQNISIFYPATITGLLHHGFCFLLTIALLLFNWFRPNLKKCYYFPMIFSGYITIGTFAQHVLKINGSMLITKPILNGTPINCWFILTVGTALVVLASLVYSLIKKSIETKKLQKQQPEENQ